MKTRAYIPLTEAEATRLASSLLEQLEVRFRHMLVEASMAFGRSTPAKYKTPPQWVLRSIRIVYLGKPVLPLPFKLSPVEFFECLGALLGMSKTWEAVLTDPLTEERELEERYDVLKDMRERIKALTSRSFRSTKRMGRKIDSQPLRPEWRRAFYRGLESGADEIVSAEGVLNLESTIRTEICYFMWVYWPQIKMLSSVRELADFFAEMRQDEISQKNLEKVCHEIGFNPRARGRPKNLFCVREK